MIKNDDNPWINMSESSQRRVDVLSDHNIFWITDLHGNYGFLLRTKNAFRSIDERQELKGVSIVKRNSADGFGELFLILETKEDWQIFHTLCMDLVSVTHRYSSDEKMLSAVEVRINRWQHLLKKNRNIEMTLEKQMGLFSELVCLNDIVAKRIGLHQAVISWVGPELDKHDFLIDDSAIEVKSYRTSKGAIVHISSLRQLDFETESLFLISYGLTRSDNGKTIEDIAKNITDQMSDTIGENVEYFENKLMEYGYIPELFKGSMFKFNIDIIRIFTVTNDFPRIDPNIINNQITSVNYTIDLSQCTKFEIEIESYFTEEFKDD